MPLRLLCCISHVAAAAAVATAVSMQRDVAMYEFNRILYLGCEPISCKPQHQSLETLCKHRCRTHVMRFKHPFNAIYRYSNFQLNGMQFLCCYGAALLDKVVDGNMHLTDFQKYFT